MSNSYPDPGNATAGVALTSADVVPDGPPNFIQAITARLAAMRFWTFSALLHLILILLIGGKVLVDHQAAPDFEGGEEGLVSGESSSPEPPAPTPQMATSSSSPSISPSASVSPAASEAQLSAIVSAAPSAMALNAGFNAAPAPKIDASSTSASVSAPTLHASGLTGAQRVGIQKFTGGWAKAGGRGGMLKDRQFEFTAYLAKYADGDWDSTVRLDPQGNIIEGSLPNLLFVMKRLSRDKVKGEPQVKPLDLSSEEIFTKKPPFIFFTGHRDFKLTDKEILNLRNYIVVGGCIWGDSSLPGHRSRFDIAFRREMKRVIADKDKQWKEIPLTHTLFTKCYFPDVKTPPPGINYYHEPVYGLVGVGGEIGVIYTANDYGDMFQFGIDEQGNIDLSRDEKLRMVAVNEAMWYRRNLYFRNIEPKALLASYKFGMNIVIHMMTRWEDKIGIQTKL